ncbi:neocarzinostatin apoprotein domain-containing protein [Nocardioides sp. 616]|uniref:neocarzinostatin apoprotein domain-containing protein n=1 Tax=Nocardioides sp. 616 TaxID=2268090 RepID=UPI0013B3ECE5|nr:neocarzinostatin apoprotein domain-containing protein [Nocardioides sp. 616]
MGSTTTLAKMMAALIALFVVAIVGAPPSLAAGPSLEVSAKDGLKDGQQVTISGRGFAPGMGQIAAGQCIEGYTGPSHCNLQGGATFRNADGGGSIGTFTIVVKEKFGEYDCTVQKCVIAAAPLPTAEDAATVAANQVVIPVTFGGAEPAAATAETSAEETTQGSTDDGAAATDDTLPQTGAGEVVALSLLGALALLLAGAGLGLGAKRLGRLA